MLVCKGYNTDEFSPFSNITALTQVIYSTTIEGVNFGVNEWTYSWCWCSSRRSPSPPAVITELVSHLPGLTVHDSSRREWVYSSGFFVAGSTQINPQLLLFYIAAIDFDPTQPFPLWGRREVREGPLSFTVPTVWQWHPLLVRRHKCQQ